MNLWRRIVDQLSHGPNQADVLRKIQPMLQEAHALVNGEEYEKGRQILLGALEFRDQLHDAKTIDWILTTLASTWLFQDRSKEQIAFFSEYLRRYPRDCAAYRERATGLWYGSVA